MEEKTEKTEEKKKDNKTLVRVAVTGLVVLVFGLGFTTISLKQQHEKFKKQSSIEQNDLIKKFDDSYQQIEKNLFEITAHENILRANFTENGELEGPLSPEERIARETKIIQSLITENELLINQLQNKLGEQDQTVLDVQKKNRRLKRNLSAFKSQIKELELINLALTDSLTIKEIQNKQLLTDLELKQLENDSLNADISQQKENYLAQQANQTELQKSMNTSYYVVGEYKELVDLDVVKKKGGILGIGSTKSLKEDFDQTQFKSIDRNNFTMIPVFSKKAELATSHPSTSYNWIKSNNEVQWLEIKQPENFWKQTKYLVVITDKKTQLAASDL